MLDYIVVGSGIAGLCFAEIALGAGKSIAIFENDSLHTSSTAAGVYNPIILKRYTVLSDAQEQLDLAIRFFSSVENRLGIEILSSVPVHRKFASIAEQNEWFHAMDKPGAAPFMSKKLIPNANAQIISPLGFGEVLHTGFVDTAKFVGALRADFENSNILIREIFDPMSVVLLDNCATYKNISARHIVFAEGYANNKNPFFSYAPVDGTKGEILTVKIPGLNVGSIIKAGVFILPMGDDVYRIGSTYDWDDKTLGITSGARMELLDSLSEITKLPVEVIDHQAGIRPTTKDRKPIIGPHPIYPDLYILNGLGTRGVMLGPYCATELFNHIEHGSEIKKNMNISRFNSLLRP